MTLFTTNHSKGEKLDVPLNAAIDYEGVSTYFFNTNFVFMSNIISITMLLYTLKKIGNFDLVLLQSLYQASTALAGYLCRCKKIPYILRPHGTLDPVLFFRRRSWIKRIYIDLIEKRNFESAKFIQYSSAAEEAMTPMIVSRSAPGVIISEGINIKSFEASKRDGGFQKKYPFLDGKTIILFLGRFHQKKGIEMALEAFHNTARKLSQVHFVLIGSGDPDYEKKLRKLIMDGNLISRVTFLGQVPESEKLLALSNSDIFILLSFGENFGIAVVEAMAAGLPVLISNKVAIADELKKAGAAIVTDCDVDQVSHALESLVLDADLRNQMSKIGRSVAREKYSIEVMAVNLDKTYRSLFN